MWLTALLVFRLDRKRSDVGIVAHLHNSKKKKKRFKARVQIYFDMYKVKM